MSKIIFFFLLLSVVACENAPIVLTQNSSGFPYDLNEPNLEIKLSGKLIENSALSLSADAKHLITLNDEEGILFFLDKKNGAIVKEIKFDKKGDFEGVEAVGNKTYAVDSDGDVFEIDMVEKGKLRHKKYENDLKKKNDIEGLGYDSIHHQLLIACKGRHADYDNQKVVFGFDIIEERLTEKAVLSIHEDSLYQFIVEQTNTDRMLRKILSKVFSPSGIAIHPISGDWYLISSRGKILLVVDKNGTIKYLERLSPRLVKQPEGICFDRDGTLYISSEGDGGKGRLLRYDLLETKK